MLNIVQFVNRSTKFAAGCFYSRSPSRWSFFATRGSTLGVDAVSVLSSH